MSISSKLQQRMHNLRVRNVWATVLVACWALLNAQLAIAGHQCNMNVDGPAPMIQHVTHMQGAPAVVAHHMQVSETMCEKHCSPDSMKQDHAEAQLTLHAIPVSTEIAAIDLAAVELPADVEWRQPPPLALQPKYAFVALENNS
ncbi:hypothetical protein [Hafnia paralvei]|uniref:hypothetical protein n=1 Tax=Hafnia paralvei TaxID=546367 RepID=UPI000AF666D6|nr:hypothetical protein [Hafnia paralvei]MCE9950315.1 hypothetical protein [Hafnia paralvei]